MIKITDRVYRKDGLIYKLRDPTEFKTLTHLPKHPDLIEYLGCKDIYVLLKYIPGSTLNHETIKSLSWMEWKPILKRFMNTLDFLHHHRILHLDLSFGNVILSDNRLVLIDFDSALLLEEDEEFDVEELEEEWNDFISLICSILGILNDIKFDTMLRPSDLPKDIIHKNGLTGLTNQTTLTELIKLLD